MRKAYSLSMFLKRFRRSRKMFAAMKGCPIFQDLSLLEWRRIECILYERTYQKGELIFTEGEEGQGLYVILSGRVQMARRDGGTLKEIAQLKTGETFGELTLINGSTRTAQAVAMEECELVGFFRPDLLNLLQTNPRIAAKLYYRLASLAAQRLRQLIEEKQLAEKDR